MGGIELLAGEIGTFFGVLWAIMMVLWVLIMVSAYGCFLFLLFSCCWRILRNHEILTGKPAGPAGITEGAGEGLKFKNRE